MRLCDGCGIKVPRFRPRVNQNGQMLCDGCAEGRPGGEGRPIGYHGSKTASEEMARALENARQYGIRFGQENLTAYDPDHHPSLLLERELAEMRAKFVEDKRRFPQLADRLDQAQMEGVRDWDNFNRPWQNKSKPDHIMSRKVAHDSGDGETIYHCPFCGGGQVTGGSDGSVECGFCHTLFTVQVQPEHAAMPQTINGVPQQMPGMPGEAGGDPNAVAPPVPGGDTGTDAFVPPDAFAPPETPAVPGVPAVARLAKTFDGDEQAADDKACDHFEASAADAQVCDNCLWTIGAHDAKAGGTSPVGKMPTAARFYINANGVALPEESYMRHLAIAFADDPAAVIEQVKRERNHA